MGIGRDGAGGVVGRSADEERAEVSAVEVVGDVASDDLGVFVEEVEVALALLGGELEGDVDELAEAAVEARVRRLVAQRGGEAFAIPAVDLVGEGRRERSMSMTDAYGAQSSSTWSRA